MVTGFKDKIYSQLKKVPEGRVTTYKELAKIVDSRAYRVVGRIMNMNPYAPEVPCHRVVNSDGSIGGYAGGVDEKVKMLESEGVEVKDNRIVDFQKKLFTFNLE